MSFDPYLRDLVAQTHEQAARRIQWAVAVAIAFCIATLVACAVCVADANREREQARERLDWMREQLRARGISLDEE